MLNFLDRFLDRITMYRLVLYVLLFLVGSAVLLGFTGLLSYSPIGIIASACLFTLSCYITNKVIAYIFKIPTNVESAYITALILTLIMSPLQLVRDIPTLLLIGVVAMASKYILAIKKKHLFNPAAIAAVISAFLFHTYASWWIGTAILLPVVIVCGVLVVRKIQRSVLVWSFLLTAIVGAIVFGFFDGITPLHSITSLFLDSALIFFATIMLTEPLTTPPTKNLQIVYGVLAGFLFAPQIHVGQLYSTPELVLVAGNIFSYIVSPKQKLLLTLTEKKETTNGIGEFIFSSNQPLHFLPGQYMEWTLSHKNTDSRGNRRYFTIASSPTENFPQLGIRFYPNGSSFKNALRTMKVGDTIAAGQLAGEFTFPKDTKQKLVFLAGGIGITPFRSMIQYCIDAKEQRDIVLFYTNRRTEDIRYKDIFKKAEKYGIQTHYITSGKITPEMLQKEVPNYQDRLFYLSGSQVSVKSFEEILHQLGVPLSHIKKDFFPGLA